MSINLHDEIIRIPLRLDKADSVQDIVTSAQPRFWNGTNVKFELAFFYGETTLLDLSDFDSVELQIKDVNSKTGLPYMQKTLSSGSLNNSLTLTTWQDGSSQHCEIEFDKTETLLPLSSDSTDFWLVVSALVTDTDAPTSRLIVLGAAKITVMESGATYGAPDSVIEPTYLTQAQSDARYVLALDLTAIEADVATALAQSATAESDAASALSTAALAMPKAGGNFTGHVTFASTKTLTLSGVPTTTNMAATKGYVDSQLSGAYVPLNGSVQMTGMLLLFALDPTLDNHAVRRKWITDNYIVKTGATDFTGHQKLFSSSPTDPLHAASKGYVDAGDTAIIGGAPSGLNTLNKIALSINSDTAVYSTLTTSIATKVAKAGDTMTGALSLYTGSSPSGANAIWKSHADSVYIKLDGTSSAATGHITLLNSDGTLGSNSATRKGYVDVQDALKLSLTGGTLTGAIQFSGASNYGMRLANFASSSYPGTPLAGSLIFDTTTGKAVIYNGTTWTALTTATSSAPSWFDGSGAPSDGTGNNGDYYVETQDDDDEGKIWKKISGTWAGHNIVGSRLPIRGGTMTGAVQFDLALDPAIAWPSEGYSLRAVTDGGSSYNLEFLASSTSWFVLRSDGDAEVATGYIRTPTGKGLKVNGVKVVGNQGSAIPNYGPGGTADDAGATANAILGALRTHGLIA